MEVCRNSSNYSSSSAVEAFHSIPHRDIDLQDVSPQFQPSNPDYREAIIIWGLMPLLVCVCILILMSIYFICVCCCCCCTETHGKRKKSKIACGTINVSLILVLLALIAVSIWAEVGLNREVNELLDAGTEIDDFFDQYSNESELYREESQNNSLQNLLEGLREQQTPDQNASNATEKLIALNDGLGSQFSTINNKTDVISLGSTVDRADFFEEVRHWTVIAYLILVAAVLLLMLLALCCGICVTSPIFLVIMLVVLVAITLTTWAATGASLAFLMVSSDICSDPDMLIRNLTRDQSPPVGQDVVNYYLVCNESCFLNPFNESIANASIAFDKIIKLENTVQDFINSNTNSSSLQVLLDAVVAGFDGAEVAIRDISSCTFINRLYLDTLEDVCVDSFTFGVVQFSMACCVSLGLLALVVTITFHAGLFCNNRKDYDEETVAYEFPSGASAWQSYGTQQHYSGSSYTRYRDSANLTGGGSEPPKVV